jgi:two-component system phosphate regulon sensor histidine kinase PhoR
MIVSRAPGASRWGRLWRLLIGETQSVSDSTVPMPRADVETEPSLALIDSMIAGFPNPTIVIDADLRIAAFNASASSIAPALFRGEPVFVMLRTPELIDAIRRAAATRERQRTEFLQRIPLDRWYEVFVVPFARTTVVGAPEEMLLLTFNDLSPLRRVEEMRADFVANASHELRTPLAALLGFIETLQGSARDDPAARDRFLDIMQKQATRMARLIDDLLSLSRIELNAHLHPSTPVELVPLVRQVVDGLQTLARDRGVEIKVDAPSDALIVLGDRDELIRALENLVENALKYGSAGKRVEIMLARAPVGEGKDEALVAVRDHGPGIAPEHLPRLTERFYRVDIADSRAQGGTGLGLALVKHVLNHHGGRLTIESVPGTGAAFTMYLPLHTSLTAKS